MKLFKIKLPVVFLFALWLGLFFISSATSSCVKADSALKQRLPNQLTFINNKLVVMVLIDEKTLQSDQFNDTPFLTYLSQQTHIVIQLSMFDSSTQLTRDTIVSLALQNLPGRVDTKISDTLILFPNANYTLLKAKTLNIDPTTKFLTTGFVIPKQASPCADSLTKFTVPNIKFTIPTALVPYTQRWYFTLIGTKAPAYFGYTDNDFADLLFKK